MTWTIPSITVVFVVFVMTTHVFCLNCYPEVNGTVFMVNIGDSFVANCVITNCDNRLVTTEWWMKGRRVYGMDYTKRIYETQFIDKCRLVINPVKLEDTGVFTCVNSYDRAINVSVQLVVEDASASRGQSTPSLITTPSTASHCIWTNGILYMFIVYILSIMFLL